MTDFIKLINIQKSYTKDSQIICALEIKELVLPQEGVVLVTGKSGSGKTTFLNILGLLDSADSGSVIIDGKDSRQLNDTQKTSLRKKYFGFIFQTFNLIPTFSVLENIQLPLLTQEISSQRAKEIEGFLERVGLASRRNHLPQELSQGEQQRVAAVRALVNNPKAILADEPTSNLDPQNTEMILNLLQDVCQEKKMILVLAGVSNWTNIKHCQDIQLEGGKIL